MCHPRLSTAQVEEFDEGNTDKGAEAIGNNLRPVKDYLILTTVSLCVLCLAGVWRGERSEGRKQPSTAQAEHGNRCWRRHFRQVSAPMKQSV